METRLVLSSVMALMLGVGYVYANEGHEHGMENSQKMNASTMEGKSDSKSVEVGNKLCPVTGNPVDDGSMGDPVKYEYNGKVYNLCCKMCAKDFKNDPEKYSKIAEDEAKKAESSSDGHAGHDHGK